MCGGVCGMGKGKGFMGLGGGFARVVREVFEIHVRVGCRCVVITVVNSE